MADLIDDIEVCFERTMEYLDHSFIEGSVKGASARLKKVGGWKTHRNKPGSSPDLAATAMVLAAIARLQAFSISSSDQKIQYAVKNLKKRQETSGGWTTNANIGVETSTIITCQVLEALFAHNEFDSVEFRDGLKWLLKAKRDDGGWGYFLGDVESRTLPTALALKLLFKLSGSHGDFEQVILAAKCWLLNAQDEETKKWGETIGASRQTLHHTSHAVEALDSIDAADEISERELVLQHFAAGATDVTERVFMGEGSGFHWSHIGTPRVLIAYLTLSKLPSLPFAKQTATELISMQDSTDGSWSAPGEVSEAPIWVIIEAISALQLFCELDARSEISPKLESLLSQMNRRLDDLESMVSNRSGNRARLFFKLVWRRLKVGLHATLKLLGRLGGSILFAAFFTLCVWYAYSRFGSSLPGHPYADETVYVALFGVFVSALSLFSSIIKGR